MDRSPEGVCVFGATGSIGVSTLDVIARHPDKYFVSALSAHKNIDLLYQQCLQFKPSKVTVSDPEAARLLQDKLGSDSNIYVFAGADNLNELVDDRCETVVCGIVGAAGLASTLTAVKAGKRVLLANKEPLVMMGHGIIELAAKSNAVLLPVDSEHNAIFQCLPRELEEQTQKPYSLTGVKKIILTGSGGPFRELPKAQFATVTPDQACAHPNWQMGRKISVDSATMMNKGLELIEACVLFEVNEAKMEIVIHPQSVIHSLVEYVDGSVLAQLGSPDMRIPITNALSWPHRIESGANWLDLVACGRFDFESPDLERFPALKLARQAAISGGSAPIVLNAANEIAVDAFLNGQTDFSSISRLVDETLQKTNCQFDGSLQNVLEIDQQARNICLGLIPK